MNNLLNEKSKITNFAKLAKERLKKHNYTPMTKLSIDNTRVISDYVNSHKKENKTVVVETKPEQPKTSYEEELYKKVCNIIETNNTNNPISLLIDRELFNNLDTEAKQFYINNLTQKYKYLRARYFREHTVTYYM